MNNQFPGYNMPNQMYPFPNNQEDIRNLEMRVSRLEREVRKLEGKINYMEQNKMNPYSSNSNYQPNSYNMF